MSAAIIDVSVYRGETLDEAVRDAPDGVLKTTVYGRVIVPWIRKTQQWGTPTVLLLCTHTTSAVVLALLPGEHYSAAVMANLAAVAIAECGSRCRKVAVRYKGGDRGWFEDLATLGCPVFVAHVCNDRGAARAARLAGLVRDYLIDSRTG